MVVASIARSLLPFGASAESRRKRLASNMLRDNSRSQPSALRNRLSNATSLTDASP
jgi:hypothetical protein